MKSIHLAGRISENNLSKEKLDFVEEKLKTNSKSKLIRKAISALYREETKDYQLEEIEEKIEKTIRKAIQDLDLSAQNFDSEKEDEVNKEVYNELDDKLMGDNFL